MSPIKKRLGDDGTTGILGEGRVPKFHLRVETLGSLDEASAALGLARSQIKDQTTKDLLKEAQRDLYVMMSEVAATSINSVRFQRMGEERVAWLESRSDEIAKSEPLPSEFILPGDSLPGAALALARTIVRRAERRVAEMLDKKELNNPALLQYLNRLSSLCFSLELFENRQAGITTSLAKEK